MTGFSSLILRRLCTSRWRESAARITLSALPLAIAINAGFALAAPPKPTPKPAPKPTPKPAVDEQRQWREGAGTARDAGSGVLRVALIIGNTHYGGNHDLKNPENDARAMANVLQSLGFTVLLRLDQSNKQMVDDLHAFSDKLKASPNGIGLFYFSGHGAQIKGSNYLLPVGFSLHTESDVAYDAVSADRVLAAMQDAHCKTNIVILDACRDNPFTNATRDYSGGKGLAPMDAPSGTFIAYATAPGKTADDDSSGKNGLYTGVLLNQLQIPGQRIEDVFMHVRVAVKQKSNGGQVPWEEESLENEFYFSNPPAQEVAHNRLAPITPGGKTAGTDTSGSQTHPAPLRGGTVPEGTPVQVVLDEDLQSGQAKQDQVVHFLVQNNVADDSGKLLIKAGTPAFGKVTKSKRRGSFGQPGKLEFTCDYIQMPDGSRVPLRQTALAAAGRDNRTASVATAVLLSPLAGFMKGRDVTVKKGTPYPMFVDKVNVENSAAAGQ